MTAKKEDLRGKRELLSALPKVDKLMADPEVKELLARYPKKIVIDAVREIISRFREEIISGKEAGKAFVPSLISSIEDEIIASTSPSLVPVINATGVVLHTNLGRAPLSDDVLSHVVAISRGYSNLEYDLESGERDSRASHIARLIGDITGAESGIIVNNNAGGVLLCLNTLAEGGEVIVSRGELVEIGGAFRIPDVMKKSGARLVEVGTTNRTRFSDYERAITTETALILKVHTSNYRIVGFTEEIPGSELSPLGKRYGIPVMEDLGSGCIVDLARYSLANEPTVGDAVASGVDLVTFSGDKLLGGAQAGFIVGKAELIERIRKNPLHRALRIDKLTLAACEATLFAYKDHELAPMKIPTLAMLIMPYEETKRRAYKIARLINRVPHPAFDVDCADDSSEAGGGSLPTLAIPTRVVSIFPRSVGPDKLEKQLRKQRPPIISRITKQRVIIDPRTIRTDEIAPLVSGVLKAMGELG